MSVYELNDRFILECVFEMWLSKVKGKVVPVFDYSLKFLKLIVSFKLGMQVIYLFIYLYLLKFIHNKTGINKWR